MRRKLKHLFGIGKKDRDGRQVRVEHRGKFTRASRTGGIAARAEAKVGPINVTANTAKGVRVSTRIAVGTRVALQNGRTQLIGRWRSGPFGVNLSKTGVSASVKNRAGAFNFIKPQYSSFKLAGIHIRGRNAAYLQMVYMAGMVTVTVAVLAVRVAAFVFWLTLLLLGLLFDLLSGFFKGYAESKRE